MAPPASAPAPLRRSRRDTTLRTPSSRFLLVSIPALFTGHAFASSRCTQPIRPPFASRSSIKSLSPDPNFLDLRCGADRHRNGQMLLDLSANRIAFDRGVLKEARSGAIPYAEDRHRPSNAQKSRSLDRRPMTSTTVSTPSIVCSSPLLMSTRATSGRKRR